MKGKILVAVQFSCVTLLAAVTNWLVLPWSSLVLLLFSASLAMWATIVMKPGNFNIVPTPVAKGILVTRGPYKVIRHPMYASIFIFALALLAGQFDYSKLLISLVLATGMVMKMLFEEELLRKHFPEYLAYMKKTKRVIPFIW